MKIGTSATIALVMLVAVTGNAHAIPCVGVNPLPGLPGVSCDMIDNLQQLTVTLTGGAVNATATSVVPSAFTFFGTNWQVRLTISLTDNPAGDSVFLLGRVFHLAQPHPADDKGPGDTIVFSATAQAAIAPFGWSITGLPTTAAHGNHSDDYTLGPLSVVGVPGAAGQIASWGFEFTGLHQQRAVAESGTLLLLGSGLLGLLVAVRRPRGL